MMRNRLPGLPKKKKKKKKNISRMYVCLSPSAEDEEDAYITLIAAGMFVQKGNPVAGVAIQRSVT
jgi:hypothetical protein